MAHKYLILGLLAERPMTGYDIKKHVKAVLSAVMNASYGTLYPALHKLLQEGAVEMQEVPQKGRPAKKIYRATARGRAELEEWLRQPAAADQIRREFLLKLYLAKDMQKRDLLGLLAQRRDEMETLLKTLNAEKQASNEPQQVWVMEYALSLCKAEMDWIQRLEAQFSMV
jgi:PadR family transcriptional regulator, regulatory protein AphA